MKNKVRQRDLEDLVKDSIFDSFGNKSVMVTGASGLIGSEIVLAFLCANRIKGLNTKIIALVRNLEKAKDIFSQVLDNPNLEIVVQDINNPVSYGGKVDYIIHTANTTSSREMLERPVECSLTTINGIRNILEYAKENKVSSVCYLSSIEIYGVGTEEDVKESSYGVLDSLNIRNSYPISKKLAENLCVSYFKEYGVNTFIARLTQTFGAGISRDDKRVFAQFAKSIINNEDIVLHTDGSSLKNYCYITDAVKAILTILICGKSGEAYNIANYDTAVSIRALAEMLADKYNTKVRFLIDGQNRGYAEKFCIKLNSKKLEELGWKPEVGLGEMFEKLIESLKEEEDDS